MSFDATTSVYFADQSVDDQYKYLNTLITQLTSSHIHSTTPPTIQQLTPLFSTVQSNSELLIASIDILFKRLAINNSNVRILALHCINELVDRSHAVRNHIFSTQLLSQLFECTLGVSQSNHSKILELPVPAECRVVLRDLAKQCIDRWHKAYSKQYKVLGVAYKFLTTTMHIKFQSTTQSAGNNTQQVQQTQRILHARFDRCRAEIDELCIELSRVVGEITHAIEILVPEMSADHVTSTDTDEWLDSNGTVNSSYNIETDIVGVIDEALYEQYLQNELIDTTDTVNHTYNGTPTSNRLNNYTIEIELNDVNSGAQTDDNKLLYDILRTACKRIQSHCLPLLNEYLDTLIRVQLSDQSQQLLQQQLLQRVSAQRTAVLQSIAQCTELGVVHSSNSINATDQLQQFARYALTPSTDLSDNAVPSQQQYAYQQFRKHVDGKRARDSTSLASTAAHTTDLIATTKHSTSTQRKKPSKLQRISNQSRST